MRSVSVVAALTSAAAAAAAAQSLSPIPSSFPADAAAYCSAFSASEAGPGATVTVTATEYTTQCPTATATANSVPAPSVPANYLAGFHNAKTGYSVDGSAICITGDVPVTISTQGVQLNLPEPANQTATTEIIVELLQANATLPMQVMGGKSSIAGTFSINAELCYPKDASLNSSFIEILTHGVGFDKSYWNFAPGYSYVDAAAKAGHATLAYDRLGVGLSDHPDPINVVQAMPEIGIVHELTAMLRAGSLASTKFASVVGVGHSLGSIITLGQTSLHPKDLDAAVLTGFATAESGITAFMSALNLAIAAQNQPERFGSLPNGYLIDSNIIGNQFDFFRFPGFAQSILEAATAAKQTVSLGELFTLATAPTMAANFTGPVDIVDGLNDYPFCAGNCAYPSDQAQASIAKAFPMAAASSQSILLPVTGHGVNLHYSAPQAYSQINAFLTAHGY